MICKICGAPFDSNSTCPFDTKESEAPWQGDYLAMSKELMTHHQHQVSVARWGMHNRKNHSQKVLFVFTNLTKENTGVAIPLFPINKVI